ncbi:hypothetical protein B296_00050593 [Ensete ventricosum]|uniref:Uncharacterized protein n=1 Tax=Ensete ventricosum TaxID=4639 RepID=A0A426YKI8_ENSVE|nr:hypothetical protein B296_00050593 [Ensete ventricosum]
MGNCLWCSASGRRLMTAARDGDLEEARMLLEMRPGLAKYSTFGGLSSPLHVAASGGHSEVLRAEYLSGWTALHFAAQGGRIPCIRLLAADFAPAVPDAVTKSSEDETHTNSSYDQQ